MLHCNVWSGLVKRSTACMLFATVSIADAVKMLQHVLLCVVPLVAYGVGLVLPTSIVCLACTSRIYACLGSLPIAVIMSL